MTLELWFSLALFVVATAVTPGPNNLLLLASGLNVGVRRTVPLLLGIATGFGLLLLVMGLGAAALLRAWPVLEQVLLAAGAAYLLWLAWKTARAAPPVEGEAGRPGLGFRHGMLLQAVNPKAWMMAVSAAGLYVPGGDVAALLVVVVTFTLLGLPCNLVWAMGGALLSGLRAHPARLRAVNRLLALMLVASVLLLLLA